MFSSVWLTLMVTSALAQDTGDVPMAELTNTSAEGVIDVGELMREEAAAPAIPGMVTPDTPHYDLELLYDEAKFDEGYRIARERLDADPDDLYLSIHVARFIFERGEQVDRTDETVDKKALYQEMIEVCEDGLARHPGDPHLLFAYGIAKGRLGTTRGVLASLFMAKDVEQSWLAAANSGFQYSSLHGQERLPCDAHQTLGIFYRLVPDWGVVKLLAGTKGDLGKSLWHLKQADVCAPNTIRTVKELGVTQLCIGDRNDNPEMTERGGATLSKVLELPARSPTEEIDQKHSAMLIGDPSLACEYSRDGQQDLDREKLEE